MAIIKNLKLKFHLKRLSKYNEELKQLQIKIMKIETLLVSPHKGNFYFISITKDLTDDLLVSTASQLNDIYPVIGDITQLLYDLFSFPLNQHVSQSVTTSDDYHQELLHLKKIGSLDVINVPLFTYLLVDAESIYFPSSLNQHIRISAFKSI